MTSEFKDPFHESSKPDDTLWAARREAFRDKEYAVATTILESCQKAIVDKPAVSLRDLAYLIEQASKLGRLASGLPAEHQGPMEAPAPNNWTSALVNQAYGPEPLPAGGSQ